MQPKLVPLDDGVSGVCQVDLIDLESGSRAPRREDRAAQESAQSAADTMQVCSIPVLNNFLRSSESLVEDHCGTPAYPGSGCATTGIAVH